jgi:hypothetical protein
VGGQHHAELVLGDGLHQALQALVFELPVGLEHRVGIDRQARHHLLDRRELVTLTQQAQPQRAAGDGDVRDPDVDRRLARRARTAASGPAALAGHGPQGRIVGGAAAEHPGRCRTAPSPSPPAGSSASSAPTAPGRPRCCIKVGFFAQDSPTYAGLSVADHLRLGARLNPGWDAALARDRIERLGLDPARKAGKLSGGQRAQLALTLGIAKRPELLILDPRCRQLGRAPSHAARPPRSPATRARRSDPGGLGTRRALTTWCASALGFAVPRDWGTTSPVVSTSRRRFGRKGDHPARD